MKVLEHRRQRWMVVATIALGMCVNARAGEPRELKVHLAQANNNSPYAFVRAKFEPGELADPWAVRFFDDKGAEVPYFVWDSITWQVAREGRADWGHRYAPINHAPGNSPDVLEARSQKIRWAEKNLPALGAKLAAQEESAKKSGDSMCAVMYLLGRGVPAFGKERLTLRIYGQRQVEPKCRQWKGDQIGQQVSAGQGDLCLQGLPDRLSVTWKGKELFRSAGFDAGGTADTASHADPSRPFAVETCEGIVTKVLVTGQTKWRRDGAMNWQCTYWLLPQGSCVALEGFSLANPSQYAGGPQKLDILAAPEGVAEFTAVHEPDWDKPWWLHQIGERGWVATHLFFATPLTIGYGNNPFTVNAEGPNKIPRVETNGPRLALRWFHELNDPAISRLMATESVRVANGHMAAADDPLSKQALRWEPKVDWLYRQYVFAVGEKAGAAEDALRGPLGAAAGWIDRPVSEEETAALLVGMMREIGVGGQSAEIGLLRIVPAVLGDDQTAVQQALRDRMMDVVSRTDSYINVMRRSVAEGQKPAGGGKTLPDGTRWEGWTGNPGYHSSLMPCYVRVLEFFDLPFPKEAYRQAIVRYADFGLEVLGGNPVDFEKFRTVLEEEWPSRTVSTIALMLHAYKLKPEEKYARAAKILFADLMRLVERNPHGYFPTWTYTPKADPYDTVYNPVSYDRGINSVWFEDSLDLVGRETASRFVAAQARWFVFSGQLLDTLEMDNVTAIRACNHGAHTNLRNQIGIYLYDDFDFYRGLLGDLVAWSAASCQVPGQARVSGTSPYRRLILSNATSSMVRWALDIRPGNKWLESKTERLEKSAGFRLQAWNRLPLARPTLHVAAKDAGLKSEADVLEVQLSGPAFRQPAEFQVTQTPDQVTVTAGKPAKIRLSYRTLRPDWPKEPKPVLQRRNPAGQSETVRDATWESGSVEWQADRGEYVLIPSN
jgi:hypothetical protein